ncbi:MAG TPA: GtrA family protein [Spirochaetia bacterium]|nr:GtrA family protein [Spirochaetia bacterium]
MAELERGSDLVMGSRRIRGGSYPKGWGLKRQFFSRVGGFVARLILFFPERWFFNMTDPTTGLKATRIKDAFRSLDFDRFHSKGFVYKVEMLFKLTRQNVTIKEIPLPFQIKEKGESKITETTPGDISHTILKIRISDSKTRRFIRFTVVGLMGVLVNVFALELFNAIPLSERIAGWFRMATRGSFAHILSNRSSWAAAFAAECAILHNYVLNNIWTFSDRKIRKLGIIKNYGNNKRLGIY